MSRNGARTVRGNDTSPANGLGRHDPNESVHIGGRQSYSGATPSNRHGPSVLKGASSFTLSHVTIRGGALTAVGGTQRIHVKRLKIPRNGGQALAGTGTSKQRGNPTVLSDFNGGTLPSANYGVLSFSAVGGRQDVHHIGNSSGRSGYCNNGSSRLDVLPNRDGENIPRPVNGWYGIGQHSAVAGSSTGTSAPTVLENFQEFNGDDMEIFPGAFSAVAEDQLVEYDEAEIIPS
ncbi:hypothetical protein D9757_009396 [Collybiopsis confluens]|uniref:Uncharacterized protein n=1 Tax=Collybiopsis confluens TaxID=2823264 RepID=A0A8H5G1I5_9AGAR|nr:hypothetical protein D9757_012852 [Collybiopsis confluens]KAF5377722.1 hypothetical protein D9757_009396 [Collybiopsis confluens]